jgi:hypothetical protein
MNLLSPAILIPMAASTPAKTFADGCRRSISLRGRDFDSAKKGRPGLYQCQEQECSPAGAVPTKKV